MLCEVRESCRELRAAREATVAEAIKWLQRIETKHGEDVLIYFDCPKCAAAFTPTTLATAAVHVGTKDKERP